MKYQRQETILVVEDNPANRELACDLLEHAGFRVHVAEDAEAAFSMMDHKPDLIIMDIGLPGMDGITATRKLLEIPGFDTPIVALTAHAMKGDRERALAAGCRDYLTKPIDTRTFASTISGFLRPAG
ncbi:MAG: response regulator [Opitutales bacterium]|nr:response regulator [Opitutales bacterium]